jgi:hypothetical protein
MIRLRRIVRRYRSCRLRARRRSVRFRGIGVGTRRGGFISSHSAVSA